MVKWCIIGAGGIADRRAIPAILKDKNSRLVGIMERVPKLCKELGEKYGVPSFTTVSEMLENVECDAVYIGTPLFRHKEQMLEALKYNKHVFVEKPFTMNASEGAEVLDKFISANKQLTVGYMMKYHNLHVKARELAQSGGIGQPVSFSVAFSCWYPDIEGAWRQKKELGGGGVIMDLGVHCIETVEDILGEEIVEVKSMFTTKSFNYEVEDTGVFICKTKSGVLGTVRVAFNIPDAASESAIEIFGTAGYLKARGTMSQVEAGRLEYLYSPQGDYDASQGEISSEAKVFLPEGEDIYLRQIRDFTSRVISGEHEYNYAKRALHVQKLIDEIYNN